VPQIVEYFLQNLAKGKKTRARRVSPEALAILCRHSWPGNVRELENTIYRSAVIVQGDAILPKDLPDEIKQNPEGASPAGLEELYDRLYALLKVTHPDDMLGAVKVALESREAMAGAEAAAEPAPAARPRKQAKKK